MKNYEEINSFFIETLENMDIILNNDFYENKGNLIKAREKVQNWYDNFKNNNELIRCNPHSSIYRILLAIREFEKLC